MRAILHQADLPAVYAGAVQLVHGALHVRARAELDHALIGTPLVGVGIGDLPSLTHEVLQVLPAAAAGEVLHNQPVVRSSRRSVPVSPPAPIPTFKVTRTRAVREGHRVEDSH